MALSEKDYYLQICRLLPRGPIWKPKQGSILFGVLSAAAAEFARIDARIDRLLDESDPRTSIEMLDTWFKDYGVPSKCLEVISDPTLEQKRQELLAKITSNSPLNAAYFIELGRVLGYEVEVKTFKPHNVMSGVDELIYDDDWVTTFVLDIHVASDTNYELLNTTWDVSQPLAVWGEILLECVIRAQAPAHTHVIFQYGDENENSMASQRY